MAEYRWYDVLSEITKVERKYNIRNPNWDNGFPGVFRDYGFAPVDSKGDWWTRIPDAPELPIIYAPTVTTSYTVPTGIGTTTTTGLIDTVNVIGDATFTELPTGETVATVTTAGVASSVSSAVATGAVGAAIGFGVGVGVFEMAPEFCTKISNAVFGTDLDPAEIGQLARDTNALVVIKDGVVYMAEDMINAIRDAFFDNGADEERVIIAEPEESTIQINNYGGVIISIGEIENFLSAPWANETARAAVEDFLSGDIYYTGVTYRYKNDIPVGIRITRYTSVQLTTPFNVTFTKKNPANTIEGFLYTANQRNNKFGGNAIDIGINSNGQIVASITTSFTGSYIDYSYGDVTYIFNTITNEKHHFISSLNAEKKQVVDGITPTGNQGTKDQPLAVVFPDWVSKGIETIAGDGVTKVKWLPVSLPATNPLVSGNPFATDKAQEGAMPDNYTDTMNQLGEQTKEATKTAPSYPTPPITPVPDVTPTPTPPSISGGGGSTTGFANLYNPTLAQVKEFSRWLWGSDGLNLDQLKKLLQDPMQAIIGMHVMYATPTTGDERGIQVGYINSGVNSKIVTEQYTAIDCGTVTINEYFGDARDYSPFTQVYCYLPFIGIVELNADDVVNSTLGIKYKIDVLTGCCLAQLTVKKYGLDAVLYTYTGNCAVQMPITSGNYLSTISSLLGAVVSGAAAVATGGAMAPVAIGAAANALGGGARASVAMSGSLGSNAGAMGIRKPYLIIKRVESADANGYNEFYGYPTNKRVQLSQLSGYVRVKDINLSGTNATEDEQNEIVALLREGVIL